MYTDLHLVESFCVFITRILNVDMPLARLKHIKTSYCKPAIKMMLRLGISTLQ